MSRLDHPWSVTPKQAVALQRELAPLVERSDRLSSVKVVVGLDVAYAVETKFARAAAVAFSFPELQLLEQALGFRPVTFPYVPGLLTFREAPAAIAALEELSIAPDLLLCDGQGVAHPRRFGLASHLGLYLDIPSVGVAKSRLVGEHAKVGAAAFEQTPLMDHGEQIGVALRTRERALPIYVSTGHRIGLETAVAVVIACCRGRRLPEPTRLADKLSKPQ